MGKLAKDLKFRPLDCISFALHTQSNFICVPLKTEILKYTAAFSSRGNSQIHCDIEIKFVILT